MSFTSSVGHLNLPESTKMTSHYPRSGSSPSAKTVCSDFEDTAEKPIVRDVHVSGNIQSRQDGQTSVSAQSVSEIPTGHGMPMDTAISQIQANVIIQDTFLGLRKPIFVRHSARRRASESDVFEYRRPHNFTSDQQSCQDDNSVPEEFLTPAALNQRLVLDLGSLHGQLHHLQYDNHLLFGCVGILNNEIARQIADNKRMCSLIDRKDTCIKNLTDVNTQQQGKIADFKLKAELGESLVHGLRTSCDSQVHLAQYLIKQSKKKDLKITRKNTEIEGLNVRLANQKGALAATEAYSIQSNQAINRLSAKNCILRSELRCSIAKSEKSGWDLAREKRETEFQVRKLETDMLGIRTELKCATAQNESVKEELEAANSCLEELRTGSESREKKKNKELKDLRKELRFARKEKKKEEISQREARIASAEEKGKMMEDIKDYELKIKAARIQNSEWLQIWERNVAETATLEGKVSTMVMSLKLLVGVIASLLIFMFLWK
ncbi:hypothetical protein ACEPPN_008126 [Leptodophora sp. 'Broadleaf-Isolate-01']